MSFTLPPDPPPVAPPTPSRNDEDSVFDGKANAHAAWLTPFTNALRAFRAWLVIFIGELTAAQQATADAAAAAAASAQAADVDALATGSDRNDANSSRVQAGLYAGTASTKAQEAGASAAAAATARNQAVAAVESIAGGPVASVNGKTGIVLLVPADIGALSTQPISLAAGAAVKALTASGWYRSNAASDKPADADTYGLVEVNAQDGYRHLRYGNPDGRVWEAIWNGAAWTPWRVVRFAALGAPANNAVLKDGGEYDVTTGGAAFALAVPANAVLYAGWTAVLFNNLNNWAGLLTLNRNSTGQKINGIADSTLVDQNYRRLVVVARTYDGTNWTFSVAP